MVSVMGYKYSLELMPPQQERHWLRKNMCKNNIKLYHEDCYPYFELQCPKMLISKLPQEKYELSSHNKS